MECDKIRSSQYSARIVIFNCFSTTSETEILRQIRNHFFLVKILWLLTKIKTNIAIWRKKQKKRSLCKKIRQITSVNLQTPDPARHLGVFSCRLSAVAAASCAEAELRWRAKRTLPAVVCYWASWSCLVLNPTVVLIESTRWLPKWTRESSLPKLPQSNSTSFPPSTTRPSG